METGELKDTITSKPNICPACGLTNPTEAETCDCGCSLKLEPIEKNAL